MNAQVCNENVNNVLAYRKGLLQNVYTSTMRELTARFTCESFYAQNGTLMDDSQMYFR